MTIQNNKIKLKQNRVKTFLKVYTVIIFILLFVVSGVILVNNQFQVQSQVYEACLPNATGSYCGQGPSCNRLGDPGDGNTWSCEDIDGSGDYRCIPRDVESCWYTDASCNYNSDCGCVPSYNRCVQRCEAYFAGQPGYHSFFNQDGQSAETCDGCGQVVGCGCEIADVTQPPGGCPYQPGQLKASFSLDNGATWHGDSTAGLDFECGETIIAGPVDHLNGTAPQLTPVNFYLNNNLVTPNVTLTTTLNNVQTFVIRVEALQANGSPFSDPNCRDETTITCSVTPSITVTPPPPGCNDICSNDNPCSDGQFCNYDAVPGDPNTGRCRLPNFPEELDCRVDHEIDKSVHSVDQENQIVRFNLVMTNTSDQSTYDDIEFRDDFNVNELRLRGEFSCTAFSSGRCVNANVTNSTNGQTTEVTFGVTQSGATASIFHPNLASVAGNLGPGQSYSTRFSFNYLEESFRNCAEWMPNDLPPKRDCASSSVVIPTIDTDL